jgi:hypothetical protein
VPASLVPRLRNARDEADFFSQECGKVQESAMSEEPLKGTKTQLALAIAQGVPVAAWARTHGVGRRTAFEWARQPEVRQEMQDYRRRIFDQAVGQLTKRCTNAVKTIVSLSTHAECESVRLRAARTVVSEMMKVSRYTGIEDRVTDVECKFALLKSAKGKQTATATSERPE